VKKALFYGGLVLLILFEAANVYFIMPMPGSQRMDSVEFAYVLYRWRWLFRVAFGAMIVAGAPAAFRAPSWRKAVAAAAVAVAGLVVYMTNFVMAADRMFLVPERVVMKPLAGNRVEPRRLVVGVAANGEARAYPLQFIGYHHQLKDSVGGMPVLVTYCTVCRTGRVFDPVIDGKEETFRLVGMDHFNAMLEDRSTGSWWRQATGHAVTGRHKGRQLREIQSQQVTLAQWLATHPNSLIMQPDSAFLSRYPRSYSYETGESRSALTGTDTTSWGEKSWVIGVTLNRASRAYDWNRLERERIVQDTLGGRPILLAMGSDRASFFAFNRPAGLKPFALRSDTLVSGDLAWSIDGLAITNRSEDLEPITASQEFWHSWRTFQPTTTRY
jgi:hypothetical protein